MELDEFTMEDAVPMLLDAVERRSKSKAKPKSKAKK